MTIILFGRRGWLAACFVMGLSVSVASATEPRVAGLSELVILDPAAHPEGLPAVEFRPGVDGKSMLIDIPQKIHVHRYYYSGNKEYQGPYVSGGPTIVVANNPWNGERMYIDAMLPGGFPVISYDKNSITYIFPDRRVCISFPFVCREKAVVTYVAGHGIARDVHAAHAKVVAKAKQHMQDSKFVGAVKRCSRDTCDVVAGAGMAACSVATAGLETANQVAGVIPGYQALQSLGKQRQELAAREAVRQAHERQTAEATTFIKTNR